MAMTISQKGIDLIKHYEGCRLTAYQDSVGVWTIGYGHTGLVKPGMCITQDAADNLLRNDLTKFETIVNNSVMTNLTQDQFDALVSFVYNVGPGRAGVKDGFVSLRSGNPSSLLRDINAGNFDSASKDFLAWDKAGGVVLSGLLKRRTSESNLFANGTLDFMDTAGSAFA